jgi:hypothetical protein
MKKYLFYFLSKGKKRYYLKNGNLIENITKKEFDSNPRLQDLVISKTQYPKFFNYEENKRITGSGTFIIFNYHNKKYVPLFFNKNYNSFSTLGGRIDSSKDNLKQNAIKESKEESADLFQFKPSNLSLFYDISYGIYNYRNYIVKVNAKPEINDYFNNLEIINKTIPKKITYWHETNNIIFIPLSELIKNIDKKYQINKDIINIGKENIVNIDRRLYDFLYEIKFGELNFKLDLESLKPLNLTKEKTIYNLLKYYFD